MTAAMAQYTPRQVARAARIGPRTRKSAIRVRVEYSGERDYAVILAYLCRSDLTPDLDARIHTVAYALRKCMVSGRMDATSENRIATYSPYRLCALIARIANECPETTIGGICDQWILAHHTDL
jgi:hypothetical protein